MKAKPKNSAPPLPEGLNLGPKSTACLNVIGIFTLRDLRRVGSVPAFLELRRAGFRVSLVMLYALEGALTNTDWLTVKRERKQELLAAIQ
jgi:DNA transformation protein and related proteins